jgi:hypothetical protein
VIHPGGNADDFITPLAVSIFGSIIGEITVITLSLVLIKQNKNITLLAGDTPQGILQRYLIAL